MAAQEKFRPSRTTLDLSKYETQFERDKLKLIEEIVPYGNGRLALDVGCGPGFFSKLLAKRGWVVTGVDTDESNLVSAKRYAAETHLGDAVEVLANLAANRYDLVIAFEIIEHMPKARGELLLKQINRLLSPNGQLLISTANRYSLEGLGGYYWSERIRGERWTAWDVTHVYIYTSPEILRLLKSCGFAIKLVTGYYYGGRFPFIERLELPFKASNVFPLNRVGFDILVDCHKKSPRPSRRRS
jgi:ubiquinone biosynthesis O-methyltransferase